MIEGFDPPLGMPPENSPWAAGAMSYLGQEIQGFSEGELRVVVKNIRTRVKKGQWSQIKGAEALAVVLRELEMREEQKKAAEEPIEEVAGW